MFQLRRLDKHKFLLKSSRKISWGFLFLWIISIFISTMKKLLKYMFRWQLSTPILAIIPLVLLQMGISNFWVTAFITNLTGSLIFFKVDEYIFSQQLSRFGRLRKRVIYKQKINKIKNFRV